MVVNLPRLPFVRLNPVLQQWLARAGDYFAGLSQRERRLLMVAMVALPFLILVFGVWLPIKDATAGREKYLQQLEVQWREAQELADRLVASGQRKKKGKQDLLSVVEGEAAKTNARSYIKRIRPQASMDGQERLQVLLHEVPYPTLVRFLDALARQGVLVARSKLRAAESPGLVHVELLLHV